MPPITRANGARENARASLHPRRLLERNVLENGPLTTFDVCLRVNFDFEF